jgi:hypothetical protein
VLYDQRGAAIPPMPMAPRRGVTPQGPRTDGEVYDGAQYVDGVKVQFATEEGRRLSSIYLIISLI